LASRTAVEKKKRKRKQQGKGQVKEVMPLVSRPAMVGKKRKRKKHGEDATADPKRKQEICNDPRKSASHICAITPKGLVNLELS
jgi:hypothetical protein